MDILRPALNILTVCGCWKPYSWMSSWKGNAYTVYGIFLYLVLHTYALSQLMEVVLNTKTADDFTESSYMLISTISSCYKITALLFNPKSFKVLVTAFDRKPFKPVSVEEMEIRKKFDRTTGSRTIRYAFLVESTLAMIIVTSLLSDLDSRTLIYRVWLPYDYSTVKSYIAAYVHQVLGLIVSANLNVACDSIFCGLLMHTCCQIEILQHRLKNITPETTGDLWSCISYHDYIYKYAVTVNDRFQAIIGIQFVTSTLVVCVNLYELANTPMGTEYMSYALYMACMLTEIFIYCWHGDQLKTKSGEVLNTVFEMKWPDLGRTASKDVLMIMKKAMHPIEITSAYVLTMDLRTFTGIMKLSYSSYNLLQTSKDI